MRAAPLAAAALLASTWAGAAAFESLLVDGDPRSAALGGARVSDEAGAASLAANPARLGASRRHELAASHMEPALGLRRDGVSWASPFGLGAAFARSDSGAIARTTVGAPDGGGMGAARLTETLLALGWGRRLGAGALAGAALKSVFRDADGTRVQATAADLGAAWEAEDGKLAAGAAAQNLSSRFGPDRLPVLLRLGAAVRRGAVRGAVELTREEAAGAAARVGVELRLPEGFAARAGWRSDQDAGPGASFGFGFTRGALRIDYALVPSAAAALAHRVGVAFAWGGPSPETLAERP